MSSKVSTPLFLKIKMTFSIKLDENYNCVFKIMLSNKTTWSEFIENMSYFHFQMQVCTHVVMCGSNENYFEQCLLIKFLNVITFIFYVYVPLLWDKVIFLIWDSVGTLTVLTQTILIRYEFKSVNTFVSKDQNDIYHQIRWKLQLCVQNNVKY